VVTAIHRRQVAEHGGDPAVRDPGLLASALARPRHLFAYAEGEDADTAALAAAYAFGIARNHPFVDGNKRTALVVCRTFLLVNGRDLVGATQDDKFVTFLRLAEGSVSEGELAAWLRSRLTVEP
jgi:death-on-curing protein